MSSKKYVLDTSVLLFSPYALNVFDDSEVLIPACVLRRMDEIACGSGEDRLAAIAFGREMDKLLSKPCKTTELDNGGILKVVGNPDKDIYDVASEHSAVIVTRDPLMRVIARTKNIEAQPFRYEQGDLTGNSYTGRCSLYITSEEMDRYAKEKRLVLDPNRDYYATDMEGETLSDSYRLTPNEYVILQVSDSPGQTMLGRFDGRAVVPLQDYKHIWGANPLNAGQRFALDALMNKNIPLVILRGPAGTAKTFLSLAAAMEQTLERGEYKRILLTRPNTKMDSDIGFLKGSEQDKVLPIIRGMLDNIENLSADRKSAASGDYVDGLLADKVIEPQAMAYMRGRSIANQFIIADEMQNSTPTQSLSIITRIGFGSKIALCGDIQQIDSPYMDEHNNGLSFAAARMKGSPLCAQIEFLERESTRSDLAREAITRMGQHSSAKGGVFDEG